jgi:phage-related tail protein
MFKNSVRTTKKTWHFTIKNIDLLTMFKETIPVYTKNHKKHKNMHKLIVKSGGQKVTSKR